MKGLLSSLYQLVCFVSSASNEIRVNVSNTREIHFPTKTLMYDFMYESEQYKFSD